jgi:hypothetical protein
MARLARIVVPGHPHHVTQRGNRRQPIFFEPSDYAIYCDMLSEQCRKARIGSVDGWFAADNKRASQLRAAKKFATVVTLSTWSVD